MSETRSLLEIGGIARAHGIKGEVVIVTHDPDSATLGEIGKIWVGGVEREILQARDTHRGWLVLLAGVVTRNDAEALQGKVVAVDRSLLVLDDEDVLLADLVGCVVKKQSDGSVWGTVVAVDMGAMQDLLIIEHGDVERMLPLVDEFVVDIDLEARVVVVDPPEDLPEAKRL